MAEGQDQRDEERREAVLIETEAGMILLRGEGVLASQSSRGIDRTEQVRAMASKAKAEGLNLVRTSDVSVSRQLEALGIATAPVEKSQLDTLASEKLKIMVRAGLAPDEAAALDLVRGNALAAAEEKISEESSRRDLHLVHGIQALDELDKFLNITSERVAEWYSLHFPELHQLIQDDVSLARMILEIGAREGFTEALLEDRGLSEKKREAIVEAAARSKGGRIADRDLSRIRGLSEITLKATAERDKLAEYVESSMRAIAPNTADVAGATIGARLIARAGGLDRLARLPASTVQVLGAEKALFRALRTGARPPKHGILFQHDSVHTAPKWQRGKIARALANKIAIAARIDYYRGEKEQSLTDTLEKRLDEIRAKYKEPRQSEGVPSRPRDGSQQRWRERPRFGEGGHRKARGRDSKSRPWSKGVRRRTRQDRRH